MRVLGASFLGLAILLSGCEGAPGADGAAGADGLAGSDGAAGLDGAAGANGNDGQDLLAPVPDDVTFSVAVTNNSGGNHVGASAVRMVFDGTVADATTVPASFLTAPPLINGTDGGLGMEWGDFESVVLFDTGSNAASADAITGAVVRAAYDDNNIYMYVSWDEVGANGTTIGESYQRNLWTYAAASGTWSKSGNEDRMYLAFPINTVADWDAEGCGSACHAVEGLMHTNNPGELLDVWHYKTARTGPTNTVDDKYWDDVGRHSDQGMSAYSEPKNAAGDAPTFMYAADPGANMDYAVWGWEMVPFEAGAAWSDGDTIPGVISRTPSGSRADVTAVCKFASPTWTCELKRLRDTGNGDDRVF